MGKTKIEWATHKWNPITGCTKISSGCTNCYAERMSKRFAVPWGLDPEDPFKVTFHPERVDEPLRWKKPCRIFICSMGDLFHDDVSFKWIGKVFKCIAACPQHTFLILTKRPGPMKYFFDYVKPSQGDWPLPNIWLGVTAENQEQADKRIPILLQIPAAVRFVSVEPMLSAVDLNHLCQDKAYSIDALKGEMRSNDSLTMNPEPPIKIEKLNWVICGGESGPRARPMHPEWASSLRDQCQKSETPFMFKQWGEWWPIYNSGEIFGSQEEVSYPYCYVNPKGHVWSSGCWPSALMLKTGKKKAGRLLDGQLWDEYPRGG